VLWLNCVFNFASKIVVASFLIWLLSRHVWQQERLNAMGLSVSLSVCLLVCHQNAWSPFSQKLRSLELWSLVTTNRKSYSSPVKEQRFTAVPCNQQCLGIYSATETNAASPFLGDFCCILNYFWNSLSVKSLRIWTVM